MVWNSSQDPPQVLSEKVKLKTFSGDLRRTPNPQPADLTGIEDMQECRRLLESHGWNLEAAVQDTLNIREGTPSVFNPPSDNPPPVLNDSINQRHYHNVAQPRPHGLFSWFFYFTSLPFRFIFSSFLNISVFIFNLFRVTDPTIEVVSFIQSYNEKYGSRHPVFYQGTYSQALNDAKRELKFLLVYLHSDDHQHTQDFCLNTLANQSIIDFVNVNLLFWACSVTTTEGYRVSQALREGTYPFMAVIVLRQNKMTIVARLSGSISPDELISELTNVMADNESSLVVARADREERSLNQTLRRQQDEAYEESLKADQEKERKKREEKLQQEQAEEMKIREIKEKLQAKEELRKRKIDLIEQIPAEPAENDPDAVRIMIKLPNGARLDRRFLKSHPLKFLYYFIFCHDQSPDNFEVVTNFPRKVLPCSPDDSEEPPKTFADVNLGKREMLFKCHTVLFLTFSV
ncbi:FAS-associated factor 2-B [Nymphon striatum]|nr:FAS-associated factor 2-B [Nymphon striatum]